MTKKTYKSKPIANELPFPESKDIIKQEYSILKTLAEKDLLTIPSDIRDKTIKETINNTTNTTVSLKFPKGMKEVKCHKFLYRYDDIDKFIYSLNEFIASKKNFELLNIITVPYKAAVLYHSDN